MKQQSTIFSLHCYLIFLVHCTYIYMILLYQFLNFSDHKKVSHPTPKKVVIKINPPAKYEGLLRRVQRSSSGAIDHDPVVTNTINEDFDEDIGIIGNGNGLLNTKRKCARCSFTAKYPYDIYLHGVNVHKRCTKCNEDFDSKKGYQRYEEICSIFN